MVGASKKLRTKPSIHVHRKNFRPFFGRGVHYVRIPIDAEKVKKHFWLSRTHRSPGVSQPRPRHGQNNARTGGDLDHRREAEARIARNTVVSVRSALSPGRCVLPAAT